MCQSLGHDHSLPGIESQNHRSRVGVRVNLLQWRIQKIVLGYRILPYLQTRGGCAPSGVAGAEPPAAGRYLGAKSPEAGVLGLMHSV